MWQSANPPDKFLVCRLWKDVKKKTISQEYKWRSQRVGDKNARKKRCSTPLFFNSLKTQNRMADCWRHRRLVLLIYIDIFRLIIEGDGHFQAPWWWFGGGGSLVWKVIKLTISEQHVAELMAVWQLRKQPIRRLQTTIVHEGGGEITQLYDSLLVVWLADSHLFVLV